MQRSLIAAARRRSPSPPRPAARRSGCDYVEHDGDDRTRPTFKVGLNTDIGGLNDRGFNHLAYVGLQQAQARLGVQTRVVPVRRRPPTTSRT